MQQLCFIFPGQGSQSVGMGKDIYENSNKADIFDKASKILGYDIKEKCFNGPEDELKKTEISQPAIFLCSVILFELLKEQGIEPEIIAGHSLGEYAALYAAGVISFEDGLKIVSARGRVMSQAAEKNPGSMAAILGLDDDIIKQICEEASDAGIVVPANFNSPGQVVISGETEAVKKAIDVAKKRDARNCILLNVSGGFHSDLMKGASEEFKYEIDQVEFNSPEKSVVFNSIAEMESNTDKIKELLIKQLTSPVRWTETVKYIINNGNYKFIESGPGNVLKGLMRRIDREQVVLSAGTLEQLNCLKDKL